MPDDRNRIVQFEKLNLLGKTLFVTGAVARLAGKVIDRTLVQAATIVAETEKAFRQGLDSKIEDAKILEEYDERRRPRR